jgi:probable F420-dependent oxidoreductase
VRRIEDSGFSTISISDHFTQGWVMEPLTALTAAACATSRIRLLTLVLGNDYRHPVLVHKAIATLDVLSEGRVELGLGAGWLASDYEAAGIDLDPPAVRLERLEEAASIIDALFGPRPVHHTGRHYRIAGLDGLPKPVQQPRPPFLIGGGGRVALGLAARRADIVGVHCRLVDGAIGPDAAADLSAERVAQKVAWVRAAAEAAGRDPAALELQFTVYHAVIGASSEQPRSTFARWLAADPDLLAGSPAVLIGDVEACADRLWEWRERYGFSYWNLGSDIAAAAPLVARLTGR